MSFFKAQPDNVFIPMEATCLSGYDNCKKDECVMYRHHHHPGFFHCCCYGNECNRNIIWNQALLTLPTSPPSNSQAPIAIDSPITPTSEGSMKSTNLVFYVIPPILGIFALIALSIYYLWYRRKQFRNHLAEHLIPPEHINSIRNPVELLNIISYGQFGCVWKGIFRNQTVAVKVISQQGLRCWKTERCVFEDYNVKHLNVINFVLSEKLYENEQLKYRIITEYHENGSLSDYLSNNVIDCKILLKMIISMVGGLAYLHNEDKSTTPAKPVVCHCDFKSRNVLVKKDLTCCISDFGLAYTFFNGSVSNEPIVQAGTPRYMSPEVLDGVISNLEDSRLGVDVYALALVIWEILSRCNLAKAPADPYALPYNRYVRNNPSIRDMQECVVEKKYRPHIKDEWISHKYLGQVCNTVMECWDEESEARLSSFCVLERMKSLQQQYIKNKELNDINETNDSYNSLINNLELNTSNTVLNDNSAINDYEIPLDNITNEHQVLLA